MASEHPRSADWNKSVHAVGRVRDSLLYEEPDTDVPAGRFAGRRIIVRDTPIRGGVYLGASPREAIVVDDHRYTRQYNAAYSLALRGIYNAAAVNRNQGVLDVVLRPTYQAVQKVLPYNDPITSLLTRGMVDKKINLGEFISAGGGVCRHQGLLAGYILERLRDDRELEASDSISIDRNYLPGLGGHAWVRYTSSDSTPYILDAAQNVVNRLDHLTGGGWDYRRPTDL
jgi:hypothetical protein